MLFHVMMTAYQGDPVAQKVVDVPDDEVSDDVYETLQRIFHYGNTVPDTVYCSVSCGDVAIIPTSEGEEHYLYRPYAIPRCLTADELTEYLATPRRERTSHAFYTDRSWQPTQSPE